jgi:tetratricopeptide (TPR) repeat protein
MKPRLLLPALTILLGLLSGHALAQQQAPKEEGQQQPETYDAYHAEKAVQIGLFYMKKGDIDAAIDRFQDAIRLRSNFARPRLLLGEAYEKKNDKAQALKYYKEYLQVLPHAPDAKKVRGRVERLSRELDRKSSAGAPSSGKSP